MHLIPPGGPNLRQPLTSCRRLGRGGSHPRITEWIEVTVNQDSLTYKGTMLLDYLMPRGITYVICLFLIIVPPLISTYLHMRWFALTIVTVVVVDILFLRYAYISFFCLLAGLGTLHLIYIILHNKCARECRP